MLSYGYGLVVLVAATVVVAIYNFIIIIRWCAHHHQDWSRRRRNQLVEVTTVNGQSSQLLNQDLSASFKYKKGSIGAQNKESDCECPVCLSAFEEGEEVRILPKCKHCFHAPCIDTWLCSHSDCPLCRAYVGPPSDNS